MANSLEEILTPEFGVALRSARQSRHLTVEQAAAKLRMNPALIEHMEDGNFHLLPPEPYRKGFIKSYAQLLEVKIATPPPPEEKRNVISSTVAAVPGVAKKVTRDAVDMTRDVVESTVKTTGNVVQKFEEGVKDTFEEITSRDLWEEADEVRKERLGKRKTDEDLPTGFTVRKQEPKPEEPPTPVLGERRRSYTAPPLVEEPLYSEHYVEEEDDDYPSAPVQGMSRSTKAIIGLLIVIASIFAYSVITKKPATQVATAPPPQTLEQPKREAAKEEKVVPPPADSSVAVASSDSLVFSVTANDSIWLSITPDRGIGGYRGKMKKGETRTFIANDKFLVYMGNQKAVSMKLNGASLSSLPTIENSSLVVRNVVLTRDKAYIKPEGEKVFDAKPSSSVATPEVKKPKDVSTPKKPTPNIKKTIPNVQPVLPNAN
ncbi:MAG TPA: RodZ domain-containing protein [Candidatus Kapabacteria bacterium]